MVKSKSMLNRKKLMSDTKIGCLSTRRFSKPNGHSPLNCILKVKMLNNNQYSCVSALADLGSEVSLININTINKLNLFPIDLEQPFFVVLVDGRRIEIKKKIQIPISYHNKLSLCLFYVVNDLPLSLLLGTDSLIKLGPRIDTPDVTIMIKKPSPIKPKHALVEPVKIKLKPGAIPKFRARYRLSKTEEDIAEEMIKDMIKEGIVSPIESEVNSPVVLIKKKNNTNRFCIDYRDLNKLIQLDR